MLTACSGSSSIRSDKSTQAAAYNAKLGAEYLRKNRLQLADEKLSRALQQNPRSAEVHHYYALLQNKFGNNATANKHFQKAIRLDEHDPELHNNYGSFLCSLGEYDLAIEQFSLALKEPLYKTPEFAYTNAGVCLQKAGKLDKSESFFREALKKNPRLPSALYEMADLSAKKGEYAKAQAFLYRHQEVAAPTAKTLWLCHLVNQRLGEQLAADKCKSALMTQFPNSEETSKMK
jgi:type IV pilus assembly protein PilF